LKTEFVLNTNDSQTELEISKLLNFLIKHQQNGGPGNDIMQIIEANIINIEASITM